MRNVIAAVLLLIAGSARVGAEPPAPPAAPWGVQQLMQAMGETKISQRKFTERKYLSALTAPLESSGYLVYRAPGHLEKHMLAPQDESMVLDQGVIVIENKSRHMKRILMASQYPVVSALVESIRATLAGDQQSLARYFQVRLDGTASRWAMQLTPSDLAVRKVLRLIKLEGRGKVIDSIEVVEDNGDRSVIKVGEEMPVQAVRP